MTVGRLSASFQGIACPFDLFFQILDATVVGGGLVDLGLAIGGFGRGARSVFDQTGIVGVVSLLGLAFPGNFGPQVDEPFLVILFTHTVSD